MFRISVAGWAPQKEQQDQLNTLLSRLRTLLGEAPQLLVCPAYTDPGWLDWVCGSGCPLSLWDKGESSLWTAVCNQRVSLDAPLRYQLGEELCDRSDLLLLVWDGSPASWDGLPWELMRMTFKKNMPCIWLSSQTGSLYWPDGSYYEPFREERLEALCEAYRQEDPRPSPDPGRGLPFLKLGTRLRARYLRRFKAASTLRYDEEDQLLREDYRLPEQAAEAEGVRQALLKAFLEFDRSAIRYNDRYQAVLYWRAILPFISTVLLAVGLYAGSLLAALPLPIPMRIWQYFAALGFLLYGSVNLYVFSLSRNETVKLWHRGFLRDRYMAELLRVALHFLPFGIRLDLRSLCQDRVIAAGTVRRLAGDALGERRIFTLHDTAEAMEQLRRLLSDQIAYHKAAEKRFRGLVSHLGRWNGFFMVAGFVVVLLRAALQVLLPFLSFQDLSYGAGVPQSLLVSSLGNALAFLVPALGSHFSTKLTLCNFRFDCGYHRQMLEQLHQEQARLARLSEFSGPMPAEAIQDLGEDLARIMLVQDTSQWFQQYESATVKRL